MFLYLSQNSLCLKETLYSFYLTQIVSVTTLALVAIYKWNKDYLNTSPRFHDNGFGNETTPK